MNNSVRCNKIQVTGRLWCPYTGDGHCVCSLSTASVVPKHMTSFWRLLWFDWFAMFPQLCDGDEAVRVGVLLAAVPGKAMTDQSVTRSCQFAVLPLRICVQMSRGWRLPGHWWGRTCCGLQTWKEWGKMFELPHCFYQHSAVCFLRTLSAAFHLGSQVLLLWSSCNSRQHTGTKELWLFHFGFAALSLTGFQSTKSENNPAEFPPWTPAAAHWVRVQRL